MKAAEYNGSIPRSDGGAEILLSARPVSRGIAVGRIVCIYGENKQFYRTSIEPEQIDKEVARFRTAHALASRQLDRMGIEASDVSSSSASIFDVHRAILQDSSLTEKIEETIRSSSVNAEWAVKLVTDQYIAKYRAIPDEHFRDRFIDVEDVAEYLQSALGGGRHNLRLAHNSIIAASELRPSTLAELSREHIAGIVTESGGWTSHTFILARELEIPAVTGVKKLMRRVKTGDAAIVDAFDGRVILQPSPATVTKFAATKPPTAAVRKPEEAQSPRRGIRTLDGVDIKIRANFDIPASFHHARKLGARGIGLFRSEYLFNRYKGFPGEAEQVKAYREIADYAGEDRARIRTFDIGVSQLAEQRGRREQNPALGLRGVRLGLAFPRHIRTQLRALLQASHGASIDIIIPMVSGIDEIRQVRRLLEAEAETLRAKNVDVGEPKLGVMIEVPSAVIAIQAILEEVDCICLGTNDLVQYLLAVDRDNESVSAWFRTLHPAVISAVRTVIEAANAVGKPVVVCGEMAGSPFYVPVLLGLGATELSMNVNSIARVRTIISGIAVEETRELAAAILTCKTADEVEAVIEKTIADRWQHLFPPELLINRKV